MNFSRTGTKIIQVPANFTYYALNIKVIDPIHVDFVDQNYNPICNFNEKLIFVLCIKRYGT